MGTKAEIRLSSSKNWLIALGCMSQFTQKLRRCFTECSRLCKFKSLYTKVYLAGKLNTNQISIKPWARSYYVQRSCIKVVLSVAIVNRFLSAFGTTAMIYSSAGLVLQAERSVGYSCLLRETPKAITSWCGYAGCPFCSWPLKLQRTEPRKPCVPPFCQR